MSTSLKTIAREVNLAEATVSRILRNSDTCSEQTRQRVVDAARRLKYRPNMLVQGIQTGRTQTIGIVVPYLRFPFARTIEAIHDALVERELIPYVLCTGGERSASDDMPASELRQIHRLIDQRVDGVIITPAAFALHDRSLREVWERNLPMVMLFSQLDVPKADFVGDDDYHGGQLVAEHLLDLGHRRVAMFTAHTKAWQHRRDGFTRTFEAAGLEPMVIATPDDYHAGDAPRRLMDTPAFRRPTAVFCETDFLTEGLCDEASSRGLKLPDDLAVIGYNDLALTRIRRPQISSVAMNLEGIGRAAVEVLGDRLDGRLNIDETRSVRIKPELRPRTTTIGENAIVERHDSPTRSNDSSQPPP